MAEVTTSAGVRGVWVGTLFVDGGHQGRKRKKFVELFVFDGEIVASRNSRSISNTPHTDRHLGTSSFITLFELQLWYYGYFEGPIELRK